MNKWKAWAIFRNDQLLYDFIYETKLQVKCRACVLFPNYKYDPTIEVKKVVITIKDETKNGHDFCRTN